MTGTWIVGVFVIVFSVGVVLVLRRTSIGALLQLLIPDSPRRRILLAAIAFVFSFALVRVLTWSIHNHVGPFHDIEMRGRHIHHLVFGIILLLVVGYAWMVDVGSEVSGWRLEARRLLCLLYGSGAALTLDEFALWLNLRDVYWAREGRSSLDAAILFGSFLIIGVAGAPLWRGLAGRFTSKRD